MTEQADPAALAGLDALAAPPFAHAPAPPDALPTGPLLRLAAGLAGATADRRAARCRTGRPAAAGGPRHRRTADPGPSRATPPCAGWCRPAAPAGPPRPGWSTTPGSRPRRPRRASTRCSPPSTTWWTRVVPGAGAPAAVRGRRPAAGPRWSARTCAATPGAVVLRTPVFELIQYLPRTETVRDVPLLLVPPLANRHYLTDLSPGRSLVEHLVAGGQQVFALSWRNPAHRSPPTADLDACAQAVLDAMDACERITRAPSVSLVATGSAGTVTAALLAHLVGAGAAERAATLTLLLPSFGPTGPAPAPTPTTAPDLLFWAADTTRVPAALHASLTDIAARDALAQPGAVRVLGTPVDLSKVDTDAYVVAGDRGPWSPAYRSAGLLAGDTRFVLAAGAPVEALIAPPGTDRHVPRRPGDPRRPGRLVRVDHPVAGSWWTDHLRWLDERSGARVDAPPELGGRGLARGGAHARRLRPAAVRVLGLRAPHGAIRRLLRGGRPQIEQGPPLPPRWPRWLEGRPTTIERMFDDRSPQPP